MLWLSHRPVADLLWLKRVRRRFDEAFKAVVWGIIVDTPIKMMHVRRAANWFSFWAVVALGGRSFRLLPDTMDRARPVAVRERKHISESSFFCELHAPATHTSIWYYY